MLIFLNPKDLNPLQGLTLSISRKHVQAEILFAMMRFKNVVRWKAFWRDQKKSTKTELNELNEEENCRFMSTGLNTGLHPTFVITAAKHGSDNFEGFLTAVRKTLHKEAFKRRLFECPNRKKSEI